MHGRSGVALAVLLSSSAAAAQSTARFDDVAAPAHSQATAATSAPAPAPPPNAPAPLPATNALPSPAPSRAAVPSPPAVSWATNAAAELVARAERAIARGAWNDALSAYTEAIRMDSGYGPAYLGLGQLRASYGDMVEAERVFERAVRMPAVAADALAARAALRRRTGRDDDAFRDLEASVRLAPEHQTRLLLLARWYVERKAWAAALALWRRRLASLADPGDEKALAEARLQVRALSILARELDPVQIGGTAPDWVRRALANMARRGPPRRR